MPPIVLFFFFALNVVPSIATQYIRDRKLHDATARRWTETHAQASPSIPAPSKQGVSGVLITLPSPIVSQVSSTEVVQTRSSRPSRTSNLRPQTVASPPTTSANTSRSNESSRATIPSSTAHEEIIILDSDEDILVRDSSKGKKRKRQPRSVGEGPSHTLDLDSDDEHNEPAKRTKAQTLSARSSTHASGSSIVLSSAAGHSGDVIIIDD